MKIENIKKRYSKKEVLKDINFDIKKCECVGILGGNGCGKSTLLAILAGVLKPDGGRFVSGGIDLIKNHKQRGALVGYVPQGTPLIEELTAYDNLRLWYDEMSMKKSLCSGVLSALGIDEFLKVPVCKMSGGMKKRLSIGCAVGHSPKVLLLDEPGAALDILCKERIFKCLADYKLRGGRIVLVTHDIYELSLCDKLYILKNGIMEPYLFDGDAHHLAERLQNE